MPLPGCDAAQKRGYARERAIGFMLRTGNIISEMLRGYRIAMFARSIAPRASLVRSKLKGSSDGKNAKKY